MEREEIEKEYLRKAKIADQRLRALEKYEHEVNFETATKWAYARARRDIQSWGGSNRFGTSKKTIKKLTTEELTMKLADVETFLNSKSSTKSGIKEIYVNRANTFNKKYGTNVSWQEFANFIKSDSYDKIDAMFGSETIMETFHKSKDLTKEEAEEIVKKGNKSDKRFDPLERQVMKELLKDGWYENGKD